MDTTLSACPIPDELMLEIFASLSTERGTLFKLLFLHPRYQNCIERLLYRSMTDWIDTLSYRGFISTVSANPRLASYVDSLACVEESKSYQLYMPEMEIGPRRLLWENIVLPAIKSMTNLKNFLLRTFNDDGTFSPNTLLAILRTKRLESFKWSSSTHNYRRETEMLYSFLHTQPHLVEISVTFNTSHLPDLEILLPADIPHTLSFPNLRRLAGSFSAIELIMSHSPGVQHLVWRRSSGRLYESITPERIARFGAFLTDDVVSFALADDGYQELPPGLVQILSDRCHSLRCLQIPRSLYSGWEATIINALANMPHLRDLVITGPTGTHGARSDFSSFYASIPSLQAIYSGPHIQEHSEYGTLETVTYESTDAVCGKCKYGFWKRKDSVEGEACSADGQGPGIATVVMDGFIYFDHSIMFDDLSHVLCV